MLKTVLSLFMLCPQLPLPTHEEVLVCSKHTTEEEVCGWSTYTYVNQLYEESDKPGGCCKEIMANISSPVYI